MNAISQGCQPQRLLHAQPRQWDWSPAPELCLSPMLAALIWVLGLPLETLFFWRALLLGKPCNFSVLEEPQMGFPAKLMCRRSALSTE